MDDVHTTARKVSSLDMIRPHFRDAVTAESAEESRPADYWVIRREIFAISDKLTVQGQDMLSLPRGTAGATDVWLSPAVIRFKSAQGLSTRGSATIQFVESGTREAAIEYGSVDLDEVVMGPSTVAVNLGDKVPVKVSKKARALLATAPWPALGKLLKAVHNWSSHAPVEAARVRAVSEPEDPTWVEVVVELRVDTNQDDVALGLWDEIGRFLDETKSDFTPHDRAWFDRNFAVHLHWGADPWDDESESV